jgi:sugar/nucleoside kinase (ribokinase family)
MTKKKYQLIGIGSAILDVLSYKPSSFIQENDLQVGSMKLVDFETCQKLYENLGSATECSGGSTGNSVAAFAMLGGRAAFIGKTRDDFAGRVFKKEMEKVGADFISTTTNLGLSTSKCVILVTEEEGFMGRKKIERTMATYLDPKVIIDESDITEDVIKSAEIIFAEGYLFDNKNSRAAVLKAFEIAKKNGVKVAFSLSDPFCVQRHKEDFVNVSENSVDILFANEHEAAALYDGNDIKRLLHKFTGRPGIKCITRSESGSYVIVDEKLYDIEPVKTAMVYDVTGAGDCYAAGFLFGYANGHSPEVCGKIAATTATEVIKYLGARPLTDLAVLYDRIVNG